MGLHNSPTEGCPGGLHMSKSGPDQSARCLTHVRSVVEIGTALSVWNYVARPLPILAVTNTLKDEMFYV